MELWGTLRQRIGVGSHPVDSDEFVDAFFKKNPENPVWELPQIESQVKEFVQKALQDGCRGVALVTSGATTVPLDFENENFVDLHTRIQEYQGPACAEYLLHIGYVVLFIHRTDSLQPFTRYFQKYIQHGAFMEMLSINEQEEMIFQNLDKEKKKRFQTIVQHYRETKHRLFNISFTSVQQYLMLLRMATQIIHEAKSRGMIILAARVMEFYVALDQNEKNKQKTTTTKSTTTSTTGSTTSSTSSTFSNTLPPPPPPPPHPISTTTTNIHHSHHQISEYSVNFVRVPNLLRKIRKTWAPKAFVVTFKHCPNETSMVEASHLDIEKWGIHVVAGTNVNDPHQILLITEQEEKIISCPKGEDLKNAFATSITKLHFIFQKKRNILKKGKQLLLLSAKFAMLKEKDLLNEDAEGNKNVIFGKGVKIQMDRSRQHSIHPHTISTSCSTNININKNKKNITTNASTEASSSDSPVYELKYIFQNKSKCARGHFWEAKIKNQPLDVVIAFSPAGTPDTIRDVWGDFWSGWAEEEIKELQNALSHVSFSSALDIVTASISGDYRSASAVIQYVWSKIGSAWTEGEQTRVRQSLQNMIAMGFDRGLTEIQHLSSIENLLQHPRIRPNNNNKKKSQIFDDSTPSPPLVYSKIRKRLDDFYELKEEEEEEEEETDDEKIEKAKIVRVHRANYAYFEDMIDAGILDAVKEYLKKGASIHVTGYSMGGMLGQLLMLYIGDIARINGYDTSAVNFVGFGTPRIGDVGFAARMRMLFEPEQVLIVMHPSDSVHAFPPTSEGYADAALKIFLKEDDLGVGRRQASTFSLLPMTRSIDKLFERVYKGSSRSGTNDKCAFCESLDHSTGQHRCRYCTQRGSHRGVECPYRHHPCALCGNTNHCTGEHRCKVCQQYGHRGRDCHAQRDMGTAEIVAYFRFHHFLYYNSNLKTSVEFAA